MSFKHVSIPRRYTARVGRYLDILTKAEGHLEAHMSTKRTVTDEIISDSEPEREALRRRAKNTRRLQKELAKLNVPKIIDLTDSDSESIPVPGRGTANADQPCM